MRQLEREIAALTRKATRRIVSNGDAAKPLVVAPESLKDYLGAARFVNETAETIKEYGIATGLAWTPVGGEILFIEATRMPGKGSLLLTGSLGEVMKESAQTAVSYLRSQAKALGIDLSDYAQVRPAHPCAGGRDAQGRAQRGGDAGGGAGVAADAAAGAVGRGDDRRDQPARAGDAGGRHQGEGAGGGAVRHQAGDSAGAEPGGLERGAGGSAAQDRRCISSGTSPSCCRWRCARNETKPRSRSRRRESAPALPRNGAPADVGDCALLAISRCCFWFVRRLASASGMPNRARRRWTRCGASRRGARWWPSCWPRSRSRTSPTPGG